MRSEVSGSPNPSKPWAPTRGHDGLPTSTAWSTASSTTGSRCLALAATTTTDESHYSRSPASSRCDGAATAGRGGLRGRGAGPGRRSVAAGDYPELGDMAATAAAAG